MVCPQCGALIEDGVPVCGNCGVSLNEEIPRDNIEREQFVSGVPALREFADTEDNTPKDKDRNIFVKCVSVLCAVVCFCMFMFAAGAVESNVVSTQVPSVFGGIFGSSQSGISAELGAALHYAFIGMGFAFSGMLLILGFKKK